MKKTYMYKSHKIRNVEKSVCCAEQMVAYNIASRVRGTYGDKFRQTVKRGAFGDPENPFNEWTEQEKKDCALECLQPEWRCYMLEPSNRYDTDFIYMLLRENLVGYLEGKYSIATDYKTVGEWFRIPDCYDGHIA